MTKKTLERQVDNWKLEKKEHQADVRYKRIERSALVEHSAMTGLKIDWENVKILVMEEDWRRRKAKESWNIKMTNPKLNGDEGTLQDLYCNVWVYQRCWR